MEATSLPSWKDIPAVSGMPQGYAWGLFDNEQTGKKDELGTLNLLTPKAVLDARSEIQTGISVALNWGLEKQHAPGYGRNALTHTLVDWKKKAIEKGTPPFYSYDDEISVNTQTGSQWDGQRHWANQSTGMYYNGTAHDEIPECGCLGVDNWTKRGGLVGRGILVDYVSWAAENNIEFDPMSSHSITLDVVKKILQEKNVTPRAGDILLMRSGWVKWYEDHSQEQRNIKITHGDAWIGMEATEDSIAWLWDNHFSAIAGDSIGFEVTPLGVCGDYTMHDYCIAGWGMPIGGELIRYEVYRGATDLRLEMWDLEALAEECKRQNRWSFFITSAPLNLKGGAASPPNALAVF